MGVRCRIDSDSQVEVGIMGESVDWRGKAIEDGEEIKKQVETSTEHLSTHERLRAKKFIENSIGEGRVAFG